MQQPPTSIHQFIRLRAITASPAHSGSQWWWRQSQQPSGKDCLDPWQLITGPKRETKTNSTHKHKTLTGFPHWLNMSLDCGRKLELDTETNIQTPHRKVNIGIEPETVLLWGHSPMSYFVCSLNAMMEPKTNVHSGWQEVSLSLWVRWIYLHASTRTHSSQFKKSHKYVYLSQDTPISQSTIQKVMPLSCLTVRLK